MLEKRTNVASKEEGTLEKAVVRHKMPLKASPREVEEKNLRLLETSTKYFRLLKPKKETCEFIAFIKDLVLLVNGVITLAHFLGIGVPLGGRLKLLEPRNTYVRTDKPIFIKFEYIICEEALCKNLEYQFSLKDVNGDVLWGPFKASKRIDQNSDVIESHLGKCIIVEQLVDYKNLEPNKEYKWVIKTKEYIRSATFRVLDENELTFLVSVEKQIEQFKELNQNERDLILGALYEQMCLLDDAYKKYKSLIESDPSIVLAFPRMSAICAKKASKFFTTKTDIRELSSKDIDRSNADLATEADYWTKRWKDNFSQIILDLSKEANDRIKTQ